jgi:hypothetical protein
MSDNTPISHELPAELQRALTQFQRKWRWLNTLTLLGLLGLIPLLSFALLSLSDRLWATPDWVRFVLAVPVPVLMVICIAPWVKQWVLNRPDQKRLATYMGTLDPRVGDRLLGAVELSKGGGELWAGSPALRRAAIRQVASQLADVHAEEHLDLRWVRKLGLATAVVSAAVVAYMVVVPDAAINSFQRWLKPHEQIERFTFVRLTGFPGRLAVPHGEAFDFEGEVSHVNGELISRVESRVSGPEQVETETDAPRVRVRAEGMTRDREIVLTAGDARTRVLVNPLMRPELLSMAARIEWPAYLEMEAEERLMRRRRLEVPAGSTVKIHGSISRELESMEMNGGPSAEIEGADFRFPGRMVEELQTVELSWRDREGLTPSQKVTVDLVARADQPPAVAMSGMAPAVAVLADEFLELDVSARDDFGLKRVWNQFRLVSESGGPAQVIQEREIPGKSGAERIRFSPERLGYGPNSTLDVKALALDAYPDREPSESSRFRVLVLSKEDHAKILLQQMERLLGELDESIRQEAMALEANQSTAERSEEDLMHESTDQALEDRALEESVRAEELSDTVKGMEGLIAEATKNDQITDEQIADWASISEELKNAAVPAMQEASASMQEASEASEASAESGESGEEAEAERRESLEQAIAKQQEALEAMQQGEEDLNESIENSLSESFVNRFKELARLQFEVRTELEQILPEVIGLALDQVPGELKEVIEEKAGTQADIFRESRYIFDDLNGFYRRSRKEELREVTDSMTGEKFTERLPELRKLILANSLGRTGAEAAEWNRLFLEWAAMLSPDEDDSGGGGGGGEAGDDEGEDLETMIALIRAREQQEKLRLHTRTLDESYPENISYDRDAVKLSDRQYEMAIGLQSLENRVKKEETKQVVSMAAGQMMNAGVNLRRSVTSQDTISIQTEVIELLAQALDQSMGGGESQEPGESQQNSAAMMQAIMEMMAGASSAPGGPPGMQGGEGSTGAGDPGRGDVSGNSSARPGREDGGGKAGASDPEHWPGRYRGQMDSYFQAMEERP